MKEFDTDDKMQQASNDFEDDGDDDCFAMTLPIETSKIVTQKLRH